MDGHCACGTVLRNEGTAYLCNVSFLTLDDKGESDEAEKKRDMLPRDDCNMHCRFVGSLYLHSPYGIGRFESSCLLSLLYI